jgi:hypothetical protein
MSIHFLIRRGLWLIFALLAGSTFAGRAEAASLDPIYPTNYGYTQPSLDFGNANKIAVGKLNQIHAVFADADSQAATSNIVYEWYDPLAQVANQPSVWEDHMLTSDGVSYLPALAVDSDGLAVVVWVSKPTPQSTLGSIWYTYQTGWSCYFCWSTPQKLVYYGTEPSIAVENHVVYVAWTTRDRVQFTTFQKAAPPSTPLWLGDVVDFTNCPNSQFHQPSIAFVRPPCAALSIRIAALYAADEQSSGGSCHDANTHAGPRVYERDNTTTAWSENTFLPAEVASDSSPNQQNPVPVSLSLSANRLTGEFFLAWSDELDSVTRTRLGHGGGATWDFTSLDTLGHHVHVAAQGGGATGKFRLAVSDQNGWSTGAYTQTGKWSGGVLSWTGAAAQIADASLPRVEHPQALYWSRCALNQRRDMKVYTEADDFVQDGLSQAATDLSQPVAANCHVISTADAIPFPNCWATLISIAPMHQPGGADAVVVDLGDDASAIKLSETGAEITTLSGGTILATWQAGDILASWENGFAVATPRASVRFSSTNTRFSIEDLPAVGGTGGK